MSEQKKPFKQVFELLNEVQAQSVKSQSACQYKGDNDFGGQHKILCKYDLEVFHRTGLRHGRVVKTGDLFDPQADINTICVDNYQTGNGAG